MSFAVDLLLPYTGYALLFSYGMYIIIRRLYRGFPAKQTFHDLISLISNALFLNFAISRRRVFAVRHFRELRPVNPTLQSPVKPEPNGFFERFFPPESCGICPPRRALTARRNLVPPAAGNAPLAGKTCCRRGQAGNTVVVVDARGLRRGLANSATCVSTLTHLGQYVGTAEPARWHRWVTTLAWLSQCVATDGAVRCRKLGQSVDTSRTLR